MAPRTRTDRGKELVDDISNTASNVGETTQGELLLAIKNIMKEKEKHRKEMAT